MMALRGGDKLLFLLLMTALFPTLLFALNLERYVLSVFWIVVLIEACINGDERNKPYAWVAATGTTLTGGAFFPLLTAPRQSAGETIKHIVRAGLMLAAFLALFGKLPVVFNMKRMIMCVQYTGVEVSFADRWNQFLNFVASCFIPTPAHAHIVEGVPRFWSDPVTSASVAGLTLLGLALLGFLFNHKNRLLQICFGWAIFSFVILCLIGWGTAENGLILYSLYFSWAYVCLVFGLCQKLLAKTPPTRRLLYAAATTILLLMSVIELARIVAFGMEHYPIGLRH